MKNLLITGGAGFIGSNLVKILNSSKYKLRIYDNFSKGQRHYLPHDIDIIEGDIRDRLALKKALNNIDAIIHLAAYGSVVDSVEDPSENFDINVLGTFNILQEARHQGIKQIIFSSTGGALIGNAAPPVNEESIPRPISPYGASKLCAEAYCCAFAESYRINITALRFANVIGPNSQHKKGATTAFIKAILNNSPIIIYGDGTATRDFLYVEDLCQGIKSALDKNLPGFHPIHLSSGQETSIFDLAKMICDVLGKPNHPIICNPKRVGEVERNFADFSKARELLEFSPQTNIRTSLIETINSFDIMRT
ncbi:NAD-dependent epimerase/dehydratase family protein [uncultured Thiothrix sp.]|uniref:NAD-dependent epimerase/dehydratase family protein n=1 Tax=uncultured Thiothrix sp. TaxID=223185 RepID=UPI002626D1B7|nr:NAD-dependent epimerase/dehydratase family protein [uncultured Thiothrix sp.]